MTNLLTPEQIYDRWAPRYEETIENIHWSAPDEILKATKSRLTDNTKILEAGCGTGYLIRKFLDANPKLSLSGVDISEEMIKRLKDNPATAHADIRKTDLEKAPIPFPDKSFDIVVSCGVLEYLEDLSLTCSEISRVLKDNGLVALAYEAEPEEDPETTRVTANRDRHGLDAEKKPIYGVFFSYRHAPKSLSSLLEKGGLSVLSNTKFLSIREENEEIYYNLMIAVKHPAAEQQQSPDLTA